MKQLVKTALLSAVVILFSCNSGKGGYDASGTFEATEVIVSAESNGRLMRFTVEEGSVLDSGQQVGYIDTMQLYLRKKQLEASIKAIDSRLSDIYKQIAATEQQIATQKSEKRRFENLVRDNAANQKQVDDIQAQISVLEKQLVAQKSTLEKGNAGMNGEAEALFAQIEQLQDQISKSIIVSPITGTVLGKYAERGELAVTGKALFKIADTEHLFLRAYLTSDQLSHIKIGEDVTVCADFGGESRKEFSGVIAWISDKSEFTPKGILTRNERANLVYAVKIAVKNDGYMKIGMYGEVKWPQ